MKAGDKLMIALDGQPPFEATILSVNELTGVVTAQRYPHNASFGYVFLEEGFDG